MITKGSIIKTETNYTYAVIGIYQANNLTIKEILSKLELKRAATIEDILYLGVTVIASRYTKDFLEKDIEFANIELSGAREIGKIKEEDFNLWLQKVSLLHPELHFNTVLDIDKVLKKRLKNKEFYQSILEYCSIDKKLSNEKAKRIYAGKIYYYRIDGFVFYALALGEKEFLNLGTNIYNITYYMMHKDYILLDNEELYKTGVKCKFYRDLYEEMHNA